MMKKLQQEEQQEAPAPGMKAGQKGESFSSLVYTTSFRTPEATDNRCFNFAFTTGIPSTISLSIFHPPCLV